ncbi:unnamed protein product [Lepidochelys kempii]
MELEAMSRYTSPVNPAVFPHLTVVLLAIGMFFTAWFFVYPPATEQPGAETSQMTLRAAPAPSAVSTPPIAGNSSQWELWGECLRAEAMCRAACHAST